LRANGTIANDLTQVCWCLQCKWMLQQHGPVPS